MLRKILMISGMGLFLIISTVKAVEFDWTTIGNQGNDADSLTGFGSVNYEYKISTYEVTYSQYVEFLNAVAKTDTYGLYNSKMSDKGGVTRTGSAGNYNYTLKSSGWSNHPMNFVTWYDALRFVNWLHNGQPIGLQTTSSTENGVYDLSLGINAIRQDEALYALATPDEWYKAAYYDPNTGVYYLYGTGTNSTPNSCLPQYDDGNSANFWDSVDGFVTSSYTGTTEVGAYDESESPYGTYDQSGNLWEWVEETDGISNARLKGGAWSSSVGLLTSTTIGDLLDAEITYGSHGFRVVSGFVYPEETSIPEPISSILFGLTLFALRFLKR